MTTVAGRGSLARSVGWLSLGTVMSRVAGALSGVVAARALGVSGRGELALAMSVGLIAGGVLPLGLDAWATRTLGGGSGTAPVRHVLRRHLAVVAVVVVLASLVALVVGVRPLTTGVVAVLAFGSTTATLRLGVLLGNERSRSYALASMTASLTYAAAAFLLWLTGLATVASFVGAAAIAQAVEGLWPMGDEVADAPAGRDTTLAAAWRFGAPTAAAAIATILLYRLDLILMSAWRGTDDAGLYAVAIALTEVVWVVPTAAAQAVMPRSAKAQPTVDTARVHRVVVLVTALSAVAVAALAPVVVPLLFGDEFRDAARAVPALAAAAIAVGSWKLLGHDLLGRGAPTPRVVSSFVGVVVMLGVDAVLVPRYGIVGAAIGSLVAYSTAAAIVVVAWCRHEHLPSRTLVPGPGDLLDLRRGLLHRGTSR